MLKMLRAVMAFVVLATLAPAHAGMLYDPATSAARMPGLVTAKRGIVATGMPAGALGIFYADQVNASGTRSVIPNEVTRGTVALTRPVNDPEIYANQWSGAGGSASFTDGQADEKGRPRGVLANLGGAWGLRSDNVVNFNAGLHTLVVYTKATAPVDVKIGFGFGAPTGNATQTIGTGWTRLTHAQTMGAGNDNPINIVAVNAGTAGITFGSWFVYEGADPGTASEAGGHMWLGSTAKDRKPAVAANELDTTGAFRLFALADAVIPIGGSSSATLMVAARRTLDYAPYQSLIAGHRSTTTEYGEPFAGYVGFGNAPAVQATGFDLKARHDPFVPGTANALMNLKDQGYHIWTFMYDGATQRTRILLDDIVIGVDTGTFGASSFSGLWAGFDASSGFINSMAYYNRALTKTELAASVATLRAKVLADGLPLDPMGKIVFWAGDSNTQGSADTAPGGRSFPYLYKAQASGATDHYGVMLARNGGTLADMVAQGALLDIGPALLTRNGRKIPLVGMIGTNDASTTFTAPATVFAQNLLDYWGARKAAGFTTVAIGILPRTDDNAAAGFEAWRTTINAALAGAVGNQLDAYVNPADDPLIGAATASDNAAYYYSFGSSTADKVHLRVGPGDTGHGRLMALVKAKLDALLN